MCWEMDVEVSLKTAVREESQWSDGTGMVSEIQQKQTGGKV